MPMYPYGQQRPNNVSHTKSDRNVSCTHRQVVVKKVTVVWKMINQKCEVALWHCLR